MECMFTGLMVLIEKQTQKLEAYKAAQILFNNNSIQPSNIKCIGIGRCGFWHMA